eukprot:TRINITY_DN64018_c0_g1_i1.p1 TRINITY_DN64018_c0_g1~~TRINITY_DN64018_c0_g1_i1.p1  ORF type:complete len:392 (+),score=59.80 TRINITY_DN64018_c0_g1_i1:106-1176(+)
MVFWQGKGCGRSFEEVASDIDTVVSGPHASAAFPAELRPFISERLTRRKQYDFSDVITGPVGRAWAEADPGVVFVENPHSRVVQDPNRKSDDDPEPALREFYARLGRQRSGEVGISFKGVDTVRPITFSGEDVIMEPSAEVGEKDLQSWNSLVQALKTSAELGPRAYITSLERVMELVLADRRPGRRVVFVGLHDTNTFKMRDDGAIVVERPEAERMPPLVNFGNLGDFMGDPTDGAETTMPGAEMRRVASAWAGAFDVEQDFAQPPTFAHMAPISFNRPYAGGHEVQLWSSRLCDVRDISTACFQVEFDRAALLGPRVTDSLRQPGTDWPAVDADHVADVARRLSAANALLRAAS